MVASAAAPKRRPGGRVVKSDTERKVQPPDPASTQQVLLPARLRPAQTQILYASDCSGLDGGAVAMGRVRPHFVHWFGSEREARFRKCFVKMHPSCLNVFEDVTTRDLKPLIAFRREHPDLPFVYTSGFPCQPFSKEGMKLGAKDARTKPAWAVADTISELEPDVFVLENVAALVEDQEHTEFVSKLITKLVNKGKYYIDFRVLDSSQFGVPATRRRVYIVGVRRDRLVQSWSWPAAVPMPPLSSIFEPGRGNTEVEKLSNTGLRNLAGALQKIKLKNPDAIPSREPYVP